MSDITKNLKQATGYDWQEINDVYLKFRLKHSKRIGQMCVFTPDDLKKARARLFLPEQAQGLDVHKPDVFLKKYLNARQQIVKNMPWVKFDLDDFNVLPSLSSGGVMPSGIYTYEIKLTGSVKIRKYQSQNNTTLSAAYLKSLSANSSQEVGRFLTTLKTSFNYETQQFSFGASILDEDGVVSLRANTPTSWTGSITPSATTHTVISQGWEIQTQFGYEVTVTVYPNDADGMAAPAQVPTHSNLAHDLKIAGEVIGGIAVVGLIIFFAPEILAIAGTIATVAGSAFTTNSLQRI